MPYPQDYSREFGFASFQETHPQSPLPGDQVDVELDAIHASTDAIIAFLARFTRSDGRLANGSVGVDQLAPDLSIGFKAPTTWESSIQYVVGDTVFYTNKFYNCEVAHTSGGTFTPEDWSVIVDFGAQADVAAASAAAAAVSASTAASVDGIFSAPVLSIITALPGSPAAGARYLVAHSGTSGALVGKEDQVAAYISSAWVYSGAPATGQKVFVQSDSLERYWTGSAWVADTASAESYTYGSGARARNIHEKLGEWLSVLDYGANTTPGTTILTSAIQSAIDSGAPTLVVPNRCAADAEIFMRTANQRLVGVGPLSSIEWTRATSGNGLTFSGSSGLQRLEDIKLLGLNSNVAKLVSVKSPYVNLNSCDFVNDYGHVIYGEDEVDPIYEFELGITDCDISGKLASGYYGVRFGLYSQGGFIRGGNIEHCGTGVKVDGATTRLQINPQVIQNHVDFGVDLDKSGSSPLMSNIDISAYFEQCATAIHAKGGEFHNNWIHDINAYRNSGADPAGKFFWAEAGAAANSTGFTFERVRAEAFTTVFQLDGEYASRIIRAQEIWLDNCTNFAAGAYADNAYEIVIVNPFYVGALESGAFLSQAPARMEAKNAVMSAPLQWGPRDFLEKIVHKYEQTGGTGVTTEFLQQDFASNTSAQIATAAKQSTDGTVTVTVGSYGDPAFCNLIRSTYDNTGTSGYVRPYRAYFRK